MTDSLTDRFVIELISFDGADEPTRTPIDLAARDNNPFATAKRADGPLSLALMKSSEPTPQACWRNALLGYWAAASIVQLAQGDSEGLFDDDGNPRLYYVEGQMVMPLSSGGRFAIEHAWLETEDGRVIETTLREAATQPDFAYFPAIRLSIEEALNLLARNRNTLPLHPLLYREHHRAVAIQDAMRAAFWHAYGIDVLTLSGVSI